MPLALVLDALSNQQLHEFNNYSTATAEVPFSTSRLDVRLDGDKQSCFIEIKSVTLVKNEIALFPDSPTSRGKRHVEHLIEAVEKGYRSALVFVILREDVRSFALNYSADPAFSQTIAMALEKGVEVYAYRCRVTMKEVQILGTIPLLLNNLN